MNAAGLKAEPLTLMNGTDKEHRFNQLVGRKLAGDLTDTEAAELNQLLAENPHWRSFYEAIIMPAAKPFATEAAANKWESIFTAHQLQMQLTGRLPQNDPGHLTPAANGFATQRKRRRRFVFATIAVSFCVLITGYILHYHSAGTGPAKQRINEITTRKGNKTKITLPDGTLVQLNSDSKLSYANFQGGQRAVTLEGEAFFDVVKDSLHPFLIHTSKMNIRVLGTAFNVKAYPADQTVETALLHGRIEVTFTDRPQEKLILNPKEKLVLKKDLYTAETGQSMRIPKVAISSIVPVVQNDSLLAEVAWIQNKLVFSGEAMEQIARVLERKFDVSVTFADAAVKDYRYSGVFEQESLERILEILALSRKFRYGKQGNNYLLSK